MRIHCLIMSAMLISAALAMYGQEAAPPSVDLYEEHPEPTATPPPVPNGPELPEISELDQAFSQQKSLGKEGDALRLHVEWRKLKNRTVNDPDVQAAKAYAQAARTDLEKRKRLREYYNVYYQRMSALAPNAEIKLALQGLKDTHQTVLAQPRVRPTPIAEGATPTPTPAKGAKKAAHKHKKKKGRM